MSRPPSAPRPVSVRPMPTVRSPPRHSAGPALIRAQAPFRPTRACALPSLCGSWRGPNPMKMPPPKGRDWLLRASLQHPRVEKAPLRVLRLRALRQPSARREALLMCSQTAPRRRLAQHKEARHRAQMHSTPPQRAQPKHTTKNSRLALPPEPPRAYLGIIFGSGGKVASGEAVSSAGHMENPRNAGQCRPRISHPKQHTHTRAHPISLQAHPRARKVSANKKTYLLATRFRGRESRRENCELTSRIRGGRFVCARTHRHARGF